MLQPGGPTGTYGGSAGLWAWDAHRPEGSAEKPGWRRWGAVSAAPLLRGEASRKEQVFRSRGTRLVPWVPMWITHA